MAKAKRKGLPKKKKVNNGPSIFDFLNDIVKDKKFILNPDNEKTYSPFMILKFLSVKPEYLMACDMLVNYLGVLGKYEFHGFAMSLFDNNRGYIIPKGTKINIVPHMKECEEEVLVIANHFGVTKKQAFDYYGIGGKEFVNDIKKLYGIVV